jgi:DNA-binding transcriptional LysR family regulator
MDAAFIRTSLPDGAGLAVDVLLQEPMVVALPIAHALVGGRRQEAIPFQQLANETFILYGPPGTGMYDAIIAACLAAGFNPSVGNLGASTQQAPRIASTLSLVAAGLGITFVPESLQRMNLEGVAYRPLRGPVQPRAALSLASRRADTSVVVRKFINVVRAVANEFSGRPRRRV